MNEATYSLEFLRWFRDTAFYPDNARKELKELGIESGAISLMVGMSDLFRTQDVLEWITVYWETGADKYVQHYITIWESLKDHA